MLSSRFDKKLDLLRHHVDLQRRDPEDLALGIADLGRYGLDLDMLALINFYVGIAEVLPFIDGRHGPDDLVLRRVFQYNNLDQAVVDHGIRGDLHIAAEVAGIGEIRKGALVFVDLAVHFQTGKVRFIAHDLADGADGIHGFPEDLFILIAGGADIRRESETDGIHGIINTAFTDESHDVHCPGLAFQYGNDAVLPLLHTQILRKGISGSQWNNAERRVLGRRGVLHDAVQDLIGRAVPADGNNGITAIEIKMPGYLCGVIAVKGAVIDDRMSALAESINDNGGELAAASAAGMRVIDQLNNHFAYLPVYKS